MTHPDTPQDRNKVSIEHWPVLDCLGRRVEHLCHPPTIVDLVFEARAFRDGKWHPWHSISATVYENRKKHPRHGYEIRRTAK